MTEETQNYKSGKLSVRPIFVQPAHDISRGYAFGKCTIEAAIAAIRDGKIALVTDDEN